MCLAMRARIVIFIALAGASAPAGPAECGGERAMLHITSPAAGARYALASRVIVNITLGMPEGTYFTVESSVEVNLLPIPSPMDVVLRGKVEVLVCEDAHALSVAIARAKAPCMLYRACAVKHSYMHT